MLHRSMPSAGNAGGQDVLDRPQDRLTKGAAIESTKMQPVEDDLAVPLLAPSPATGLCI